MFTYDPKARISVQQALEHRYFSSAPRPTVPAKLPRPAPKRESRVTEYNPQEGRTVLSPPRKSRRVMPEREGFGGNVFQADKIDQHVDGMRQGAGEKVGRNEQVPMSIDFSIFASRPPNRPTINSADRSHLKRMLDLEFP